MTATRGTTRRQPVGRTPRFRDDCFVYTVTATLLEHYKKQFPALISAIETDPNSNAYFADQVFGSKAREQSQKLAAWLEGLPCKRASWIPWGSSTLPIATIRVIEKLALVSRLPMQTVEVANIAPQSVFLIKPGTGLVPADPSAAFNLGDYVVVVRAGIVPVQGAFGLEPTNFTLFATSIGCRRGRVAHSQHT